VQVVIRWLLAGLVWLVLLEAGAWMALRLRPEWRTAPVTWSQAECFEHADWVEDYFAEWWSLQLRWEPYVYWRSRAFHGRYIEVGENGFRTTWNPEERGGQDVVRIHLFGGSTLWGLGARDHHTIPSLVSQWMSKHLDRPVEVVNCGELGYVNTQELVLLIKALQKGQTPDVAVFYDGVNDVFSAYQSGVSGIPQNEYRREKEFNLLSTQGDRTAFLAAAAVYHVFRKSAAVRLASRFLARSTPGMEKELEPAEAERLAAGVHSTYVQNVDMIQALADRMGFRAMYYWQPTVFTKPLRSPHESEQYRQYQSLQRITALANRHVAQCDRLSALEHFHDIAAIYEDHPEGLFFDYCHTGERGNAIIAERMARDIHALLMQQIP